MYNTPRKHRRLDIGELQGTLLESYLPVLVFLGLGSRVGLAFTTLPRFLGPRRPSKAKQDPYECGLPSDVQRGFRFGISFYLVAMLFILFDVEAIFLYPVAVHLKVGGRLRAGRDADLRRVAGGRLRLRVAARSARVEIIRPRQTVRASCERATCSAATSKAWTSTSTSRSAC